MSLTPLADIAGRDQAENTGLGVQAGYGEIDWHPHAVFLVAEPESFLGMEDARAAKSQAHALHAVFNVGADELSNFHGQQFAAREAGQALGHRVDLAEIL